MELVPITKNDYAYSRLKEEIISGYLKPGEKLTVNTLSNRYKVSPMPVRNAIAKLQSEGFVAITPRCGAKVHVWDYDEFNNLMQMSTILEMAASKFAASYINDAKIEFLRNLYRKMNSAAMSRNYLQYEQYNHDFHFSIYEDCGNPNLLKEIESLHERTYPYTSISFHIEGRLQISMREHQEWLDAIELHDAATSELICKKQRVETYRNYLNHLENCLTDLDNPESNYYIYGFGSTFSNMNTEQINEKLAEYRKSVDLLS